MTIRVDKQIKIEFKKVAAAYFGSTCNPLESIMSTLIGVYKTAQINGVYPEHTTVEPIEIGAIHIERNLRERRKDDVPRTAEEIEVAAAEVCQIGNGACKNPAKDVMTYKPTNKEYRVCSVHSSQFANSSVWRLKK